MDLHSIVHSYFNMPATAEHLEKLRLDIHRYLCSNLGVSEQHLDLSKIRVLLGEDRFSYTIDWLPALSNLPKWKQVSVACKALNINADDFDFDFNSQNELISIKPKCSISSLNVTIKISKDGEVACE